MNWITRIKKASEKITTAIRRRATKSEIANSDLNTLVAMVFQLKEKLLNKMVWSAQNVINHFISPYKKIYDDVW